MTPKDYFRRSILQSAWHKLDKKALILGCKALAVWNYGGTAFDMNSDMKQFLRNCGTNMEQAAGKCY